MELRLGWPTWNYSADNYVLSFRSLGENVCFVSMGYVSDPVYRELQSSLIERDG